LRRFSSAKKLSIFIVFRRRPFASAFGRRGDLRT
jgi:hypothetical protein